MKEIIHEKEFLKTITKTLHNYEKLIDNPEEEIKKWFDYGTYKACRICHIYDFVCDICPLNNMSPGFNKLSAGCYTKAAQRFQEALQTHIYSKGMGSGEEVLSKIMKERAEKRYDELIKFLESIGIEYDY